MKRIYLENLPNKLFFLVLACVLWTLIPFSQVVAEDRWKEDISGRWIIIGTSSYNHAKVTVSPNNPDLLSSVMTIKNNIVTFESKQWVLKDSVCKDYKLSSITSYEVWHKEWMEDTPDDYYPSLNVFNGGQVIEVSCGSGSFKMIPFAVSKDGIYIGFPGFDTDYYTFSKYGE